MTYEIDTDTSCPKCSHSPIHYRNCEQVGCDDGWIDMYEYDDPLLFDPGESEPCSECRATGIEQWCPGCGANLSGILEPEGVG